MIKPRDHEKSGGLLAKGDLGDNNSQNVGDISLQSEIRVQNADEGEAADESIAACPYDETRQ